MEYMTVRQMRDAIKLLPDDGIVYIERVEDVYFEKRGWETIEKEEVFGMVHNYFKAFCGYTHDGKNLYIDGHF